MEEVNAPGRLSTAPSASGRVDEMSGWTPGSCDLRVGVHPSRGVSRGPAREHARHGTVVEEPIPIAASSSQIMASHSGRLVSSPAEAHDGYGARPPCGRLGCLPFRDVQISRRSRLRRVVTKPTPAGCVTGRLRALPRMRRRLGRVGGRRPGDLRGTSRLGLGRWRVRLVSAVTCFPPSAGPRATPAAGSHARGE